MEPKSSAASYALHTIMGKMPTRWEPAIGIVRAQNAQELHDHWQKVSARWTELQEAGKIKSFADAGRAGALAGTREFEIARNSPRSTSPQRDRRSRAR
jgi:hypothetical protein